jgi:hypothetical protein
MDLFIKLFGELLAFVYQISDSQVTPPIRAASAPIQSVIPP